MLGKLQRSLNFTFLTEDPRLEETYCLTRTVKSARSYQAGIVYMDKYGSDNHPCSPLLIQLSR